MSVPVTVFVFGSFVTVLVAFGLGLTIREFRRMRAEIERGYGPHLVSNLEEYQPFTLKRASSGKARAAN
jgi:hypothetical protein